MPLPLPFVPVPALARCSFLPASYACLAPESTIPGYRFSKPPSIDGVVDEAGEWKDASSFAGMVNSLTGQASPEPGRFWLGYDRDFIYFAAKLNDSQPSGIKANEYRTNVDFAGDDYVELDLDLSGSASNFNVFRLNPRGATSLSLAGGRAAKREWTGEFLSRGRITADGWEVEARIPWQIMQLPKSGNRNIRFNVARFASRLQRTYQFAFTGTGQYSNLAVWAGVATPKQALDRTVKLLPYAYAGYDPAQKSILNAGIDFKTSLADQVALVGTIKPDFRNIENQILSLDFSRFERLAGESRPFLLEGQKYLQSALFASQRIGSFDAGLNAYGKLSDKLSFGLIEAASFGKENDLAASLTNWVSPNTRFGLRVTDKSTAASKNSAYELVMTQQLGPTNLQIYNEGSADTKEGPGQYNFLIANYQRGPWTLYGDAGSISPNFNPGLGFLPERDLKGLDYQIQYNQFQNRGPLKDYALGFTGTSYKHFDGSPYRREQISQLGFTLRNGLGLDMATNFASFEGSRDELYTVSAILPRGGITQNARLAINWGHQDGLPYRSVLISGAYKLKNRLQLTLSKQTVRLGTVTDQTILSLNDDLGHDRSISGRAVRRGSKTNAYLALSQKGNLGMEYFLILGDPNAATFRSSLILKLIAPVELGGRGRTHNPAMAPVAIDR